MRGGWHILPGEPLVLTRRLPPRFDVAAEANFNATSRRRLAHQIRQDLWRALQDVRGFSPVIQVSREEEGLAVKAGGRVEGRVHPGLNDRIARLLADPALRQRWERHA